MSNVRGLISNAYYLSTVLSRTCGEQPSGAQASDGLCILNDILAEKAYEPRRLPFRSTATQNCVPGQWEYFFSGFTEIESIVYFNGNLRLPLKLDTFSNMFDSSRVTNTQGMPSLYYAEKDLNGITVYLYFSPSVNYQLLARGKKFSTELSLDDDLNQIFDRAYQSYLKYELAYRLAQNNGQVIPPDVIQTKEKLNKLILDRNPIDTTPVRNLSLNHGNGMNWAVINIGKGWTV